MIFDVRYFYLATGMEGIPDERHWTITAASKEEAIEIVLDALLKESAAKALPADVPRTPPDEFRRWERSCLSAKPMTRGSSHDALYTQETGEMMLENVTRALRRPG